MYLTRKAELAEAAALVSPLELPPTMRAAPAEAAAADRHTSFASAAGSAAPPVFHVKAGGLAVSFSSNLCPTNNGTNAFAHINLTR